MTEVIDLAKSWPEEEKRDLFAARERILTLLHDGDSIDFGNRIGMIATLSLVGEGFIELDIQDPSQLCLTDSGQRFANGVVALAHG